MTLHESYLVYRRFRYLKLAVALSAASVLAYVGIDPIGPRNGGTWVGYTLGGIGFILIGWLLYFGVRKRRYTDNAIRLQAWLSAHVYLGLSLIVVATLHTGFQFALNLHTLAYGLMMVVILSGLFGIWVYARAPALMTANRAGQTLADMQRDLAELDRQARDASLAVSDAMARAVRECHDKTRIGGNAWQQLNDTGRDCSTHAAIRDVEKLAETADARAAEIIAGLLTLLRRRGELLARIRRDIRLKAKLEVWLYFHVPLSIALLVALVAHVVSVFFYW